MDSAINTIIPQGGTAKSGESPLLLRRRSCSTGSGGSDSVPVEKPGEADHLVPPKKKLRNLVINPFATTTALKRTPPGAGSPQTPDHWENRAIAQPTELVGSPEEEAGKRKRRDSPSGSSIVAHNIMELVSMALSLESVVLDNVRPDLQVLKAAQQLADLAEGLLKADVEDYLNDTSARKEARVARKPEPKKSATIGTQTESTTCDAGTQSEAWTRKGPPPTVRTLEGLNSLTDFLAVADLKWEEEVFANVEVKVGNPLTTPHETVKCALVELKDPKMDSSIQRLYRDRFPELASVEEQFGWIEQQTRRKGSGGELVETLQKVVKISHDGSDEVLWDRLQTLRAETKGEKAIAVHHIDAMSEGRMRKLTQAVFRGASTKVEIYTTQQRRSKEATTSAPKRKKERNTLALSVDVGDRTFKDILKGVREAVGNRPGSECIQSLRSSKEEQLLIVLDKDEAARDKVVKLLEAQSLKVRQVGARVKTDVVHLRGLDELATREEVQQAIDKTLGADDNTKIGLLRPHGSNTQAVTVTLSRPKAEELVTAGCLRVGPARCPAVRRVEVKGCTRCWSYDHSTAKCNGPDRTKLCRGCGKAGHLRKDCTGIRSCVLCGNHEHALGSGRCKAFRAALERSRKQAATKQHRWHPSTEEVASADADPFPPLPKGRPRTPR